MRGYAGCPERDNSYLKHPYKGGFLLENGTLDLGTWRQGKTSAEQPICHTRRADGKHTKGYIPDF
jgi:hypothetical protein